MCVCRRFIDTRCNAFTVPGHCWMWVRAFTCAHIPETATAAELQNSLLPSLTLASFCQEGKDLSPLLSSPLTPRRHPRGEGAGERRV